MEIITQNNNNIEIIPSSFQNAVNLKKAAFECLKTAGIIKDVNLSDLSNIDASKVFDKLFDILLTAEISDKFEKTLFDCLSSCNYEKDGIKRKISKELFDEMIDLREDYYEIITKCIEANLRPFFKSLVSEFKTRLKILNKSGQE